MENIKVINQHFVVISDTEVSKNVYPQDEWKWEYRVYALNGVQVKFQDGDFYKSVTRPTEEQCLRDFFQRRKLVLTDSLAKASSEKLSIDKVLEQLDDFEKLIEINTVLKSDSKFSVGDEVYADYWKDDGKIVEKNEKGIFTVKFRNNGTKRFTKNGKWCCDIPAGEVTLLQLVKDTTIHKLVPIPEDVKIGAEVFGGLGKGVVESINNREGVFYPIRVVFKLNRAINYTFDGKYNSTEIEGGDSIPLKLIQY